MWRKSSFSISVNCLEWEWRKSSFSNPSGNCPEARQDQSGLVFLRDSKEKEADIFLRYSQDEWQDGAGVRFEPVKAMDILPAMRRVRLLQAVLSRGGDIGGQWHQVEKDGSALYFTEAEKDAWEKGVREGEMIPSAV